MTRHSKPSRSAVNKIFGEELPKTSVDEREDDPSARETEHETWLRDNIPPHHK
ncbi:hypothetical protein CQY20_08330 [Mycolicibacterium agri]|uniref:Uncharacterized protein n=1 Tax=Mycolicibacterium agri TaxID=36811 RepID=A0A2A7N946_MYCAG|nr:hypothetical protein CQY20_08330 [Mycolicibacterium agri]